MSKFAGEYSARIDDKGRVVLPYQLKAMIPAGTDLSFIVKKDIFSKSLEMYTQDEWARLSEKVMSQLNMLLKRDKELWKQFTRSRALVSLDEKLGRMTIPKALLEQIGVDREVLFVGNDDFISVWLKEEYDKQQISENEYEELTNEVLKQK